jgi:hypothetical protein
LNHLDDDAAMSKDARSVRYLKLIALFKIVKGVLLLVLGVSLLSLDAWGGWMNAPLKWIANEILLQHSKVVSYLLRNLQTILSGDARHATAFLSLFYAARFFTEGIGVYLRRRWAALLIISSALHSFQLSCITCGIVPVWWEPPSCWRTVSSFGSCT